MHGGDYNPVKELQAARAHNAGLRAKIMALHEEHRATMEGATETEGDSDEQAGPLCSSCHPLAACTLSPHVCTPASGVVAWSEICLSW